MNSERDVNENDARKIGSADYRKNFQIRHKDSGVGADSGGDKSLGPIRGGEKSSKRSLSFFG